MCNFTQTFGLRTVWFSYACCITTKKVFRGLTSSKLIFSKKFYAHNFCPIMAFKMIYNLPGLNLFLVEKGIKNQFLSFGCFFFLFLRRWFKKIWHLNFENFFFKILLRSNKRAWHSPISWKNWFSGSKRAFFEVVTHILKEFFWKNFFWIIPTFEIALIPTYKG